MERERIRVQHDADVVAAQQAARAFAQRLGFARREATEIAIVVSELCTNALKYGVAGVLVLEEIDRTSSESAARTSSDRPSSDHADHDRGVRATVFDQGPPFNDFERASRDGSDDNGPISASLIATRRGIGGGLGSVRRFSDACGWEQDPHGKHVWAERWLPRKRGRGAEPPRS